MKTAPNGHDSFDRLDAKKLIKTLMEVEQRIEARFPGSGLARVARRLHGVAGLVERGARRVRRPYLLLRLAIVTGMGVSIFLAWRFMGLARIDLSGQADALDAIQALEALFNAVFLFLAGLFFIVSVEERFKRATALSGLHRVRSITHVIDMHQLTKDPDIRAKEDARFGRPDELVAYLEFCSDLLSLTGKIGALYAQDMRDPVVIDTVNDIETLTSNLSRKIWQKITIIRQIASGPAL